MSNLERNDFSAIFYDSTPNALDISLWQKAALSILSNVPKLKRWRLMECVPLIDIAQDVICKFQFGNFLAQFASIKPADDYEEIKRALPINALKERAANQKIIKGIIVAKAKTDTGTEIVARLMRLRKLVSYCTKKRKNIESTEFTQLNDIVSLLKAVAKSFYFDVAKMFQKYYVDNHKDPKDLITKLTAVAKLYMEDEKTKKVVRPFLNADYFKEEAKMRKTEGDDGVDETLEFFRNIVTELQKACPETSGTVAVRYFVFY